MITNFIRKNKVIVIIFLFVLFTCFFSGIMIAKNNCFDICLIKDNGLVCFIKGDVSCFKYFFNQILELVLINGLIILCCSNSLLCLLPPIMIMYKFVTNIVDSTIIFCSGSFLIKFYAVVCLFLYSILMFIILSFMFFALFGYSRCCKRNRFSYFTDFNCYFRVNIFLIIIILQLILLMLKVVLTCIFSQFIIICF